MRLLDLFCGKWGWSKAFAARGWECIGVDVVGFERPPNAMFWQIDVLELTLERLGCGYDFIVASPPCEEFSVHGMKHFHPHPKYPENGIRLFNYTRQLCEASGLPYVMENVRAAQQFVGNAVQHCGPFYLWGNAVPPLLNMGIKKMYRGNGTQWERFKHLPPLERRKAMSQWDRENFSTKKQIAASQVATIPLELANCVADYAERLLEQKRNGPIPNS